MGENGQGEADRFRRFASLMRSFADTCEREGFPAYAKHLREEADFAEEDASISGPSSPEGET